MIKDKNPKEIEKELQKLIDQYSLGEQLTVKKIKDWIFHDEGDSAREAVNRFHKKVLSHFSKAKNIDELNKILQIINDAWNYLPHRSLGGKTPAQTFKELSAKQPKPKLKDSRSMPDFIVGGRRMSWDEHWAMIKEMERVQKPFKEWIEKELLPSYKKLLNEKKIENKDFWVAERFFDRALWLGFVNFHHLRAEFVAKEFPRWWQTHIFGEGSDLSEREIKFSLKKLFQFIEEKYGLAINGLKL